MDENTSHSKKRDSGNAGCCTKTRSKKNYSKKCKYHDKCTRNPTDTDTDVETVVNKNNHQTSEPSSVITTVTSAPSG